MREIDCLGEICPIPVMRLQNFLKEAVPGQEVMIVTDHSCVPRSVGEFCRKKGLVCRPEEVISGVWELYISLPEKAPSQEPAGLQQKVSGPISEK